MILSNLPGDHVTHLENVSEEEMNRLLGIVLDVEYLYTCVHKEEDADTKQVYFSLFKVSFGFGVWKKNRANAAACYNLYLSEQTHVFFIFQLLRKSILQMGKPMLEAQESPPFEKPSIEQVLTYFLHFKHSNSDFLCLFS